MPKSSAIGEFRAMQMSDLDREIKAQVLLLERVRLGVELKKEKDTAKLRRERRKLAQMKTEWTRKTAAQLQGSAKPSTVPASTKSSTDKSASTTRS
ncbi:hypothetical protein AUJ46_04625 [Candidatus Peregrinibacteria bacterium CG1_02_54_53]|nr:MAG: hypothetical protein AUJ46_04625 [Candidatus Peregrinibacteria bacterium CG1_02_54_53]